MRQTLLILITLLTATVTYGQIYGDGNINTTSVSLPGLKEIDIQFNADITLDYTASETMTITADENVMKYIGQSFQNGKLTLDQIKWIEPSKNPVITIGVPNLKKVYQGTHSATTIINLDTDKIWINGNVGKITVLGKCDEARVNVEGTDVDLSRTTIGYADITIDGSARVILNKVNELDTDLDHNADLVLLQQPNKYVGISKEEVEKSGPEFEPNPNLKYISFKIKNNSWKRNHFVVVGPKKDGNTFSYGFAMMPGFSKSEKWSVGTKIYKEEKLGNRELLVTISAEDEGQVVKLF